MSPLFSPNWYRVSSLKPRLRGHFEVHRQPFRDELTFLLQDHSSGKFFHFNASAYDIIGRLDGERSMHDVWATALDCLGDDAPTQDETIALLARLHQIDALQVEVSPDCLELFRRSQKLKTARWRQLLGNPLAVRLPLADPDRLLVALLPWFGPMFSKTGLVVWLAVIVWALVMAAEHWSRLKFGASSQVLEPANLALLAIIYPLIKACHELGHAITTRKWGGEVHEIGLTLLVLIPVPYVDAAAANVIRSKYLRMVVSAAGMMVELFLAAIALFIWLNVEPGIVSRIAFNVMLIGCVSTLVFNGNPLLRFDGYHILKDFIEVPNLSTRASRYLTYLAHKYLFRMEDAVSPSVISSERGWLVFYGAASHIYRVFITFAIILFIAGEYFVIGVLLAMWAFAAQILLPIAKAIGFVVFDGRLAHQRFRAVALTGSILTILIGCIFLVPVSSSTQAEGVLWLPQRAHIQARSEGTVKALLAEPFQMVSAGQPLVELEDLFITARVKTLEAEIEELRARHRSERLGSSEASVMVEQIAARSALLADARERAADLVITSGADGVFVVPDADELPGRLLEQGDRIGFVLNDASLIVRVVVPQNEIALLRGTLVSVEVKLAEALSRTLTAKISRDVPSAQKLLPSRALGSAGGGAILVDPADKDGVTPLQSIFQVDLELGETPDTWHIGQRAYVRFDHGRQTLASQWMRTGRQLFLRRFGV